MCATERGSCCWRVPAWRLARLPKRSDARRARSRNGGSRYANERIAGLSETGDRGNEPKYGPEHGQRILAILDKPPPVGYFDWTAPLLARELVDIREQHIWRFLRAQKIDLSGRKSWGQGTDPDFVPKAADIVGLHMAPPTNAVVLSIDEKPSIQALERAQGYLKLQNGRAMISQSHDYNQKRRPPKTAQAMFRGLAIWATSA